MTLDLGFSCFFLDLPPHLADLYPTKSKLQMTLVDCPGHASLIRTIIGGAQIIDMVLLVVDAHKGWQAQTTECLVLAELTSPHLVVALNKIDMFPESEREASLERAKRKVRERLAKSRFPNAPMVGVSACIGGEKVAAATSVPDALHQQTIGVHQLVETLKVSLPAPRRHLPSTANSASNSETAIDPFYFSIDHCFPIKGMGTVVTGTVLNGTASVNDVIEFPSLGRTERKIKSMQMFKRKTQRIQQGDRAGICVSNLDSTILERGVCATPGAVQLVHGAIALVRKIPQYPGQLKNNAKVHVSVGHATIMATVNFWGAHELAAAALRTAKEGTKATTPVKETTAASKSSAKNQKINNKSTTAETIETSALGGDADQAGLPFLKFDWNQDFLLQDGLLEKLPSATAQVDDGTTEAVHDAGSCEANPTNGGKDRSDGSKDGESLLHWALLDFQTPVYCPLQSLVIGSRLDAAVDKSKTPKQSEAAAAAGDSNDGANTTTASSCRLAFCGRLIERVDPKTDISRIRWYTPKEKRGTISRLGDPHKRQDDGKVVRYEVFGSDLFKKETLLKPFLGMKLVTSPSGDIGELKSAFGTSGKFRVYFPAGTTAREGDVLRLPFKRFAHDAEKKMRQDDWILPAARPGSRMDPPASKKKKKVNIEATGTVDKFKGDPITDDDDSPNAVANNRNKKKKFSMAIVSGFFGPETDIRQKRGQKVRIPSTQEEGEITGPFGKAGKCIVSFIEGISESAVGARAELHGT
jgi:selenocysteine-specific elongation factor